MRKDLIKQCDVCSRQLKVRMITTMFMDGKIYDSTPFYEKLGEVLCEFCYREVGKLEQQELAKQVKDWYVKTKKKQFAKLIEDLK